MIDEKKIEEAAFMHTHKTRLGMKSGIMPTLSSMVWNGSKSTCGMM